MSEAISDVKTRNCAELEEHVREARRHILQMESFRQFSEMLKDKGTHSEVATLSVLLRHRAQELQSIPPRDVSFVAEIAVSSTVETRP